MLSSSRTKTYNRNHRFSRKPSYRPKPFWYQLGLTLLKIYILLVLVHGIVFFFIGFPIQQSTNSMEPTLNPGDSVIVFRLAYGIPGISRLFNSYWSQPSRGDLVVFSTPYRASDSLFVRFARFFLQIGLFGNEPFFLQPSNPFDTPGHQIRRVIGVPGDTIEYQLGEWFITNAEHASRMSELLLSRREYRVRLPENRSGHITPFGDTTDPITLGPDEFFVAADNRTGALDSRFYGMVKIDDLLGRVVLRYYPFQRVGLF
jgi:signal peptidase I